MIKKERQLKILDIIRDKRNVSSTALAEELNVSEDTIRRDLNELSSKNLLTKIHGGAVAVIQKLYHYNENTIYNLEGKTSIAIKAASLIQDGMVIIMSGGTTNLVLAKLFPKNIKATVYTYSLPIAMQLVDHPLIEIIFIGGKIKKESMVTAGMDVLQFLSNIRADLCFMGVSSIDVDHGITDEGYEISLIKKAKINASNRVVYLATSNKLNKRLNFNVCSLNEIDTLVTELDPLSSNLKEYLKAGVSLL